MKTMHATKTLLLAAASVLAIGVGAAMAQSDGPSDPADWPVPWQHNLMRAPVVVQPRVQAGSSDIDTTPHPAFDYTTLANPG